jgi:hypothetical protein
MSKIFAISKAAAPLIGLKRNEKLIARLEKAPLAAVNYLYIIVSEDIEYSAAELITITNFRNLRQCLRRKIRSGLGLEVMIAPWRKFDGYRIGKCIENIRETYSFCESSGCQLVLSSGANSIYEMVSGPSFDSILRCCGISPQKHWEKMNHWLDRVLSNRVYK